MRAFVLDVRPNATGYIHPEISDYGDPRHPPKPPHTFDISGQLSGVPIGGTSTALKNAAMSLATTYMRRLGITSVSVEPGGGGRILVFSTQPDYARMMLPGSWQGFFTDVRQSTAQATGQAAQQCACPGGFGLTDTGAACQPRGIPILGAAIIPFTAALLFGAPLWIAGLAVPVSLIAFDLIAKAAIKPAYGLGDCTYSKWW